MKYHIAVNPRLVPKGTGTLAHAIAQFGLPDCCEIIYRGRNVVARLSTEGLILKAYKYPDFFKGLIYRWFRPPKSRRAYSNALRLREIGIPTPEPAFAIECYRQTSGLGKSYYCCFDLKGWQELRGIEQRPDFDKLAKALAEFIFDIHCKSVLMKDMSPGNVLFNERPDGGYDFALVDINRMEFDVREWGRLLENFQCLLDTEDGTVAVARHYNLILKRNRMQIDTDDFESYVRRIYRDFFNRKQRQHRLKKRLGITKKHHSR